MTIQASKPSRASSKAILKGKLWRRIDGRSLLEFSAAH
jgi:hypothetical protein